LSLRKTTAELPHQEKNIALIPNPDSLCSSGPCFSSTPLLLRKTTAGLPHPSHYFG